MHRELNVIKTMIVVIAVFLLCRSVVTINNLIRVAGVRTLYLCHQLIV